MTDREIELIPATEKALARGILHFSVDGKLLQTTREILPALLDDGAIDLRNP